MAFGITRRELLTWKENVKADKIAILTHYWLDPRFPECKTVTKVGCCNIRALMEWGNQYGLRKEWIDNRSAFPHFDLFGEKQLEILQKENCWDQIDRFHLKL